MLVALVAAAIHNFAKFQAYNVPGADVHFKCAERYHAVPIFLISVPNSLCVCNIAFALCRH